MTVSWLQLESEDFGCRGNTIVLSAQATSSGGTSNALENSSTLEERSRSRVKPGFAAPAQTLEKLLQEQISSSAPHEDQAAKFNEKYKTKKEPSTGRWIVLVCYSPLKKSVFYRLIIFRLFQSNLWGATFFRLCAMQEL